LNSYLDIPTLLTTAWLAPLVGFVVIILGGFSKRNRKSRLPGFIATGCIATSFAASLLAAISFSTLVDEPIKAGVGFYSINSASMSAEAKSLYESSALSGTYYSLGRFGGIELPIGYYIDSLAVAMCALVGLISLCVHLFSIGYMDEELADEVVDHEVEVDGHHLHRFGRFDRFFAFLGLFSFAMFGLVLSGNLLQTFIFWELVGATSYFLIGFYQERDSAGAAAKKAFVMNRIGDAGFLVGIAALLVIFGSLGFEQLFSSELLTENFDSAELPNNTRWLLTVAGIGIFAGCVGKSAQFPLQTWLKDAMAGPTPVSALVHSATMVAAGVFLVARIYPLLIPVALEFVIYSGLITLVIGAVAAIFQSDIKRILAYSTISQLGYMMLALGLGGWIAGVFHLITHAFFKSLLFLGSGSVIHANHHEQDVTKLGGLWRKMPITAATMLIATIAISGLAFPTFGMFGVEFLGLSGFHSKDAILLAAEEHRRHVNDDPIRYWVPFIGAGLTAFYMFRLWCLTFLGKARSDAAGHARESSIWMTLPLTLLAVGTMFVGWGGEHGPLGSYLAHSGPSEIGHVGGEYTVPIGEHGESSDVDEYFEHHSIIPWIGLVAALSGASLACFLYAFPGSLGDRVLSVLGPLRSFFASGWGFDRLYQFLFVGPIKTIGWLAAMIDQHLIDGLIHLLSGIVVAAAKIDRAIDEKLVDGAVNGVATMTMSCGRAARQIQTGVLRQYVMFIAAGLVALVSLASLFLFG